CNSLRFSARVISDGIHDDAIFIQSAQSAFECRLDTVHIDSICKQDDRLAALDCPCIIESDFYSVVESCAFSRSCFVDCCLQYGPVIRKLVKLAYFVIKRDYFNLVIRLQLLDESKRRLLNQTELLLRARARIDHQHHLERRGHGAEK